MEKAEFHKIMEAIESRLSLCECHLNKVHTTDELSLLTLAQAVELKSFCEAEEKIMTKMVMVDLYHVIGMANLTPPQMMKFTYAIQKYLQYRPTIKAIANHLDSISELPKIPVATQYKLQCLGDITLKTDLRECVVDEAEVDDYKQLKARDTKLPFHIDGRRIRVDMTQLDYFVILMQTISKSNLSANNFRQKIEAHKEYFGIEWTGCDSKVADGIFKSDDIYTRLSGYYNKHS
jgi:hypothetical protein